MRFGPVALEAAEGAILAHAAKLADGRLAKGRLLSAEDVARLKAAGMDEVVAAVLEPGDLTEDEAAARLAAAAGPNVEVGPPGTGRVNFFAETAGLFVPDRALVDALNRVDPGITLATLAAYAPVEAGRMVATVKIIPLAVPGASVEAALGLLTDAPAFRVASYRPKRVALVQTELPGIKRSVLDKTRRVLETRLAASGSRIVAEERCAHDASILARTLEALPGSDLTVVFGASAVIDIEDVIPAAVTQAGGRVLHLGMPVDPGNLLLLADLNEQPLIGAPGCARSIKENGFDWVLNRMLCDLDVSGEEIKSMGVGGLLMEIESRPAPREASSPKPVVDAVILAAGRSTRMEGRHKLLAHFDGVPLIRRSVETALASRARRVHVVVGHRRDEIAGALEGLNVNLIENPAFADGLSTSLRAGFVAALEAPTRPDGLLVMLADQPLLTSVDLDRLAKAFRPEGKGSIVIATDAGKRANPVILSSSLAAEVEALRGDVGAKPLIVERSAWVREIEIGTAAGVDVDTPDAVEAAGGVLTS